MADIYEQHQAAFRQVSAYVIVSQSGDRIASTAMVRGHANGYGYDKKSAAVRSAMENLKVKDGCDPGVQKLMVVLQSHGSEMDADNWDNVLRNAGYNVFQAV